MYCVFVSPIFNCSLFNMDSITACIYFFCSSYKENFNNHNNVNEQIGNLVTRTYNISLDTRNRLSHDSSHTSFSLRAKFHASFITSGAAWKM